MGMKKLIKYLRTIDRSWLIIWITIYGGFLTLGLFMPPAWPGITLLKYSGIVLTLVYAIKKFPKDYLLQIALFFTLLADTILALGNFDLYFYGVFVFCFAQFFHFTRLVSINKPHTKNFLIYFFIVTLTFLTGVFVAHIPTMYVICFIYGTTLLFNVFLAYRWHHRIHSVPATCACYGFLLFLLCDICVAFSYLSHTGVLVAFIGPVADYLDWLFYYPSQILISNSSKSMIQ